MLHLYLQLLKFPFHGCDTNNNPIMVQSRLKCDLDSWLWSSNTLSNGKSSSKCAFQQLTVLLATYRREHLLRVEQCFWCEVLCCQWELALLYEEVSEKEIDWKQYSGQYPWAFPAQPHERKQQFCNCLLTKATFMFSSPVVEPFFLWVHPLCSCNPWSNRDRTNQLWGEVATSGGQNQAVGPTCLLTFKCYINTEGWLLWWNGSHDGLYCV